MLHKWHPAKYCYCSKSGLHDSAMLQSPLKRMSRVRITGDMTRDPLPSADVYILSNVIHDMSDEKANLIIQTVCESLKSG